MAIAHTFTARLQKRVRTLLSDTRGNTMFLVAASLIPIMGLVGSGIDIGRAYMAELRLQQACDAGVLAGRRAMAGGTYSSDAQEEADKMFDYNYPSDLYGTEDVEFSSESDGPSDVVGEASGTLPTMLMQIFQKEEFNLSVACTAKLEISNTDVMMVLDVTGSMAQVNSGDTGARIVGLRNASINFFDTIMEAEQGDGRIRFGVVPYSSSANVGAILADADPDWLSDTVRVPSRTPNFVTVWGTGTTSTGNSSNGTAAQVVAYANTGATISGKNSTTCPATTPPANSTPTVYGSPTTTQTNQYVDGNGNRITTYSTTQAYRYFQYRYVWSSSACRLQSRTMQYTQTTPSTLTQPPVQQFSNYTYDNRTFNVALAKSGTGITENTGVNGVNENVTWGGCVSERATVAFGPNAYAPDEALDMDVDLVPTNNDNTRWKLFMPGLAHPRAANPWTTPSTTGAITTTTAIPDFTDPTWQANGWGSCPVPARNLETMTADDRGAFVAYINSLQPIGGTYHDSGMSWGVRLLSPTGLFAAENTTAPNGRAISRHIIFMTDGEMSTTRGNYSHQGYEFTQQRIGATSDADSIARHNNRFGQLCDAAKARNITIWVVSFGVALNDSLTDCATGDKAYQANNSAQLNAQFQSIARQISKLRLSE